MKINPISRIWARRLAPLLHRALRLSETDRQRTFRRIYSDRQWGKEDGEDFYSGHGSRGDAASIYISEIEIVLTNAFRTIGRPLRVLDIGCGDFYIGEKISNLSSVESYIGCDIVPELIARNKRKYSKDKIKFQVLDIVLEIPPDADVCIIRQVFQHLSNSEIKSALENLNYPFLIVSEARPNNVEGPANPDKAAGASVRFNWETGTGRGVELSLPPYNLRTETLFITPGAHNSSETIYTDRIYLGPT